MAPPSREKWQPKFIAIEGGDAAGKTTQCVELSLWLTQNCWCVETLSFPQYSDNRCGQLLKKWLAGELGAAPPEMAGLLYALDRYETMRDRDYGGTEIVLLNRYTPSNLTYQAMVAPTERSEPTREFLRWVETELLALPQPDVTILLNTPAAVSRERMQNNQRPQGAMDQYERDQLLQEAVRQDYILQAAKGDWMVVDTADVRGQRNVYDISQEIKSRLKPTLAQWAANS